ncbi:RNA binding protein [Arthrobacter phage Aoka]|nr:RNA binding protein [Arthrobacter phage Aoka]
MEWIALALLLAAMVAAAVWFNRELWRRLDSRRVVVNLKSGQAIDGSLVRRRGALLFLKNATLHEPGAEPVPLDGEIIIDRAEVDFIQAP